MPINYYFDLIIIVAHNLLQDMTQIYNWYQMGGVRSLICQILQNIVQ